jgi:uncharacterized phage infection (PIP) family protein YhgE
MQIAIKKTPITENPDIKKLLAILKRHKSPSQKDFLALIGQVAAMEKQLAAAVSELTTMRNDYADAVKQNKPFARTIEKAVINLNSYVLQMREKLSELKQAVIDGCKTALAEYKEKGISALDNIARFFKVKPALERIHTLSDVAYDFPIKRL